MTTEAGIPYQQNQAPTPPTVFRRRSLDVIRTDTYLVGAEGRKPVTLVVVPVLYAIFFKIPTPADRQSQLVE